MIRLRGIGLGGGARLLHSGWTADRVTLVQAAALLPPLLAAAALRGPSALVVLAVAMAAALGAGLAFAAVRRTGTGWHGLTTAMIVAVMSPEGVPYWQVGFATLSGVVLGELVFGGRGFGFVNAGAVSVAFLVFSFPGIAPAGAEPAVALATAPGAVLLLWLGFISWQIPVSAATGFALAALIGGGGTDLLAAGPALAFGVVFLIADPLGAAATPAGRWLHGLLAGCLVVVLAGGALAAAPAALVFASLLASLFAPLIDEAVLRAFHLRRVHRA